MQYSLRSVQIVLLIYQLLDIFVPLLDGIVQRVDRDLIGDKLFLLARIRLLQHIILALDPSESPFHTLNLLLVRDLCLFETQLEAFLLLRHVGEELSRVIKFKLQLVVLLLDLISIVDVDQLILLYFVILLLQIPNPVLLIVALLYLLRQFSVKFKPKRIHPLHVLENIQVL